MKQALGRGLPSMGAVLVGTAAAAVCFKVRCQSVALGCNIEDLSSIILDLTGN